VLICWLKSERCVCLCVDWMFLGGLQEERVGGGNDVEVMEEKYCYVDYRNKIM